MCCYFGNSPPTRQHALTPLGGRRSRCASKGRKMNLLYSFRYPKFQAFAENWFDTQYALTAPTNTDNCKRLFSRVVYPRIGNKKLNQINHKDIIEIITEYRKTAPKSVKTLVQLLRRVFIYAIDVCDYNLINPVKTGTKLFYKGVKYGEFAVLDMPQIPVFFKQVLA